MSKARQAAVETLRARRAARGANDPLNRLSHHINRALDDGAESVVAMTQTLEQADSCPAAGWYVANTGNHQGLVIDEITGRSVAVVYDKADAPIIAAAHDLLASLIDMIEMATHHAMPEKERRDIIRSARAAKAKARGTSS